MTPHRWLALAALASLFLSRSLAQDVKPIAGLGPTGPIVKLHTNFKFTEGPAADKEGNVYFTDIPEEKIYKVDRQGKLSVFREKSAHANGLMVNAKGEIAIVECKRAIELDPEFGNPYNDIGSYLMKLGNLEEAIPWLERAKTARRYEPRHFPFLNLGRLYAAKGQLLRAAEEFRGALRFDPGNSLAEQALDQLNAAIN